MEYLIFPLKLDGKKETCSEQKKILKYQIFINEIKYTGFYLRGVTEIDQKTSLILREILICLNDD